MTQQLGPELANAPKKVRDRALGKANRLRALARRYAILSDFVLGGKVEAIASAHGVTARTVNHHIAAAGLQRCHGRPRKTGGAA
ncbi:MAG: hypothetical protein ACO1OX_07620 [Novosphingobium sp.]